MRLSLGVVCALAILILGALQATAAVALRERAVPLSLVRFAPAALVRAIDGLEPHAYEPEALRRVLAANAAGAGDLARAGRFARSLSDGPDRSALEGAIAEKDGNETLAVADYLAAGDLVRLEAHIDDLAAHGERDRALRLQADTLATLQRNGAQNDTIAEAFYRQALVLQDAAYAAGARASTGRALELRALDGYARAAALAPLEDRYLIALGNQDLNVGRLDDARRTFAHVRELDPTSVEALTGLADASIRASDFHAAAAYLSSADTLAPQSPDVARLRARMRP